MIFIPGKPPVVVFRLCSQVCHVLKEEAAIGACSEVLV